MVSKGFPDVTTSGRQYNIGEKPSVILYTYINLHAGTPKPQSFLSKSPGLQYRSMVLYGLREVNFFLFLSQKPVAPVAQRYHVTSDTLGREFDPRKRDFSH